MELGGGGVSKGKQRELCSGGREGTESRDELIMALGQWCLTSQGVPDFRHV